MPTLPPSAPLKFPKIASKNSALCRDDVGVVPYVPIEKNAKRRTLRDQTFGVRCFSFLRRWAKVVHWDLPKYGQTEKDTIK